jgi:hypothetical protein
LKIPITKGNLTCEIYDNNKQPVLYNNVKNNSKLLCVLQFLGLRFLKQQVICEWTPIQLKLCENPKNTMKNYIINEDLLSDKETDINKQTETLIENTTNDNREELNLEPIIDDSIAIESDINPNALSEVIETVDDENSELMDNNIVDEKVEEPVENNTISEQIEKVEELEPVTEKVEEPIDNNTISEQIEKVEELEPVTEKVEELIENNTTSEQIERIEESITNDIISEQIERIEESVENNIVPETIEIGAINKDKIIENLQKELTEKNDELVNFKTYFRSIISKLDLN